MNRILHFCADNKRKTGTGNPVPIIVIDIKFLSSNHYMLWLFKLGC